uniref:Uncharacterized protein n=1 Tax=Echinococcus canadensis TaxID=519352 RepID=A0A915EWL5_9CEST
MLTPLELQIFMYNKEKKNEQNSIFNAKPFHLSKFVPTLRLNIEMRKIVGFIFVENQKITLTALSLQISAT